MTMPVTENVPANADDDAVEAHAAVSSASAGSSSAVSSSTGPSSRGPSKGPGRPNRGPGLNKPGRRTARVGGGQPRPGEPNARTRETLGMLRRSVAAETAIALVVLAATAILVDSVPGRTANGLSSQPGSTDVSLQFNTGTAAGTVLVVVEPGKIGPNQTHLLIENTKGEPYNPVQLAVSYSLPSRNFGPINSKVTPNGPGHYVDQPTLLTFAGQWQVSIVIRSDDFDETTVHVPFNVTP
jgi:copper transport protein